MIVLFSLNAPRHCLDAIWLYLTAYMFKKNFFLHIHRLLNSKVGWQFGIWRRHFFHLHGCARNVSGLNQRWDCPRTVSKNIVSDFKCLYCLFRISGLNMSLSCPLAWPSKRAVIDLLQLLLTLWSCLTSYELCAFFLYTVWNQDKSNLIRILCWWLNASLFKRKHMACTYVVLDQHSTSFVPRTIFTSY